MIHWHMTKMDDEDADEANKSSGSVGPIGQQIGKQLSGGSSGQGISTSSGANGTSANWIFSGSNGSPAYATSTSYTVQPTMPAAQPAKPPHKWANLIVGGSKGTKKSKVRYVIVKKDRTTLELREQSMITPQEMIGVAKFVSLVSTYTTLILGEAVVDYNFHLCWSELIESLQITKHFVPGLAPDEYDNDANEVLDILLYDI